MGSKVATKSVTQLVGGLFVALFFSFWTPFFYIGFFDEQSSIPFGIAGIVLLLFALIACGAGVYLALRCAKYGKHGIH